MNNKFYITTPIYYVNDKPHIGHAYTTLACDVIARFKRLDGFKVYFLTGTDEHGQKVELAAKKNKTKPQDFVDKVSINFRDLLKCMHIDNDDFIRTTEKRHLESCQKLWDLLIKKGHIYLGKYAGWYAIRDEAFFLESEIIDGKAPSGAPVEWVEEPSYFFNLSKWQDKLLEHYNNNENFISPSTRKNEVLSFVKGGLKDLSVSRTSFSWGIKVPNDDDHIMYVWLDALTNYLSAIGYENENERFCDFWPANIHLVGKDIIRFHAVYWPAFLMAADLELPKKIFAHGWWTNEGQKISKSLGNVINPFEIVEKYGVDQVRYFLMREIPFGNDGDFSVLQLVNRVNSDLSNSLGNLFQRVVSMVVKNCKGKIPKKPQVFLNQDKFLINSIKDKLDDYRDLIDNQKLDQYLKNVWVIIGNANKYVDEQAPWLLKKNDFNRMEVVLYTLLETLKQIGIILQPFLPLSSNYILNHLSVSANLRNLNSINTFIDGDIEIIIPSALFPRIENN
ncbi:methionine--tRNA ligase [Alphaproteobacteria bacterium]|nr:methionine--tRNA ligase [Alphaproteobacteria bacterium]